MGDTINKKYVSRLNQLRDDADSWRAHWKEISEYMLPRRGRYLLGETTDTNDGTKKNQKIINGSAKDALRIIAAGMQGGLTSPARPWFALSLPNEEIMEYAPVREWLHTVRSRMLNIFSRSNFYGSVHNIYSELAAFGTAAMIEEEDFSTIVRFRPFTIGEYYLGLDDKYRPNTLYRQFSQTASQMMERYGEDKVSDMVKSAINANQYDTRFEVVHCIQPNKFFQSMKEQDKAKQNKPFESVYFEAQGNSDKFLSVGGYNSIPFVGPRWEVTGVDTYGGCPGMDALGDVKMLQKMEEKKLKALDKMVDPPMNAPTSMKSKGGSIIAGGVNYLDVTQGQQGFTPVYQVNPNLQDIAFETDRVERRIKGFFFNDLFLSILNTSKTMTATEVAERHEEKLLMLGPVLERLQSEFLDVIIDRTYQIMNEFGLIPPPPQEIAGQEIKIEYISLLAQAQKLVGTSSIERTAGFVSDIANINPDIVDKIDFDEAVDQYADMVGVPPKIIRSDDKVAEIRAQRAQAQQAQMQAESAMNAAEGAKTLSEADLGGDNALSSLMANQ